MADIRPFWTKHEHHPNSDFDHFLFVCGHQPDVISPCVFSVWKNNECICVLAGRVARLTLRPRIGYFNMPGFRGRALTLIHEGLIGQPDREAAEALVKSVQQQLDSREVDIAIFSGITETSPLLPSIRSADGNAIGLADKSSALHWELTLPAQPGALVSAMRSKHRSWIRKKAKDLEAAFPGKTAWRWYAQIDELQPLCRQLEAVAARTYQRGLDAGFKDDEFHQKRLDLFAQKKGLRVILLEIDGKPSAFWFGIVYGGVFHSEATGYIPELRDYEIGTQIFITLVDKLILEGVARFDFGLGDAAYKQRFGDRSWRENSIWLFSRSLRGGSLRFYLRSCEWIDQLLRSLVKHAGIANKLKQTWRRRLARTQKSVNLPPPPPEQGSSD